MPAGMSDTQLFDYLVAEYNHPFVGWDFSHLNSRRVAIRPNPLWDYTDVVVSSMQQSEVVLDMGTGGGERYAEFLSRISHPVHAHATEGYKPNVALARRTLEPYGVTVHEVHDDHLPFEDDFFDLIMDRHSSYDPYEVLRVLKPDHRFIVMQVGDRTNRELHELLGHEQAPQAHQWNLAYAVNELAQAGWRILEGKEEIFPTRYYDVGAIVMYLKGIPWEIPDFSVEKYFQKLVEVDRVIQQDGYVDVSFHQFFMIAQKS
jgi:SAM-dependent methyltransferase